MKTALALVVLECLLLITCLQHFGMAAPALQENDLNDVSATSSADAKRAAEDRNVHFSAYLCRVTRVISIVTAKLQVSFREVVAIFSRIELASYLMMQSENHYYVFTANFVLIAASNEDLVQLWANEATYSYS